MRIKKIEVTQEGEIIIESELMSCFSIWTYYKAKSQSEYHEDLIFIPIGSRQTKETDITIIMKQVYPNLGGSDNLVNIINESHRYFGLDLELIKPEDLEETEIKVKYRN